MLASVLCSALLAACACAQAPLPVAPPGTVVAPTALAPEPAPDPKWPMCVGPEDSHRLTEIVRSDAFKQANDPPGADAEFLKVMEKANALTQRSLKEFSPVFRDGFTLVVPQNQVPTAQGDRPLFQRFGINAESISEVNATAIIRAHLILGTVTEEGLREQLQTARSVRFLSLDRDYSWTFTTGPGGGLALVDPRNPPIAEDGLLEAEVGVVAATPPGRCPNALIVVSGYMVVPEDLTPAGRAAARQAAEERDAVLAQPPPPPSGELAPQPAADEPQLGPAAAPPPLAAGDAVSGTSAPPQAEAGTGGAAALCGAAAAAIAAAAAAVAQL